MLSEAIPSPILLQMVEGKSIRLDTLPERLLSISPLIGERTGKSLGKIRLSAILLISYPMRRGIE